MRNNNLGMIGKSHISSIRSLHPHEIIPKGVIVNASRKLSDLDLYLSLAMNP